MIKIKHPFQDCNIAQENCLRHLSRCHPEEVRAKELIFTYNNILFHYFLLTDETANKRDLFSEWVDSCPVERRELMRQEGFEFWKNTLEFACFVNEKKGINLEEYVCERMGSEDYLEYKYLVKKAHEIRCIL